MIRLPLLVETTTIVERGWEQTVQRSYNLQRTRGKDVLWSFALSRRVQQEYCIRNSELLLDGKDRCSGGKNCVIRLL